MDGIEQPNNSLIHVNRIRYALQGSSLIAMNPSTYGGSDIVLQNTRQCTENWSDAIDQTKMLTVRYSIADSSLVPVSIQEVPVTRATCSSSSASNGIHKSNTHSMQTRSKTRSLTALTTSVISNTDFIDSEPVDLYLGMQTPHYAAAVEEELKALTINNTWSLISLPGGRFPIECK